MNKYNHQKIEKKWQKEWARKKIYQVKDKVRGKKNKMLLTEFPYPSGNLHIGHWYAFAVPDILARYFRMQGENVMYPIGFDAFGLPAENAAIKRKINPRDWTEKNIKFMTGQLESMGASFDWSRKVSTIDPEYYKWTQWLFLKIYEKGLAYRKQTLVNWCPGCKTVLANEQVVDGSCERCGSKVVQRELEQWMFKITDYADRLIDDIEGLDWPETTKLAQKNWIGRSVGAVIKFEVISHAYRQAGHAYRQAGKLQTPMPTGRQANSKLYVEVFTTRPDTIFGATYMVLAPEHRLLEEKSEKGIVKSIENWGEIQKYIKETQSKTDLERQENKEKTGVELKGVKAINPANGKEVPVWISDYVLAHYGTGAVMAVPAHDERDFEFSKKYNLPIKKVILPKPILSIVHNVRDIAAGAKEFLRVEAECFTEDGELTNSEQFTGIESENARREIVDWLEKQGKAKRQKNYRLRDWVLSRQRYWGAPIPMIKCADCGFVPVPDKDLPVKLPPLKDFLPTDDGRSPLAKAKKWAIVKCPKCKGKAERETDTMDTFVDSSWYFIRYTDPKNKKKFADASKMKNWLPVPMYVGGAEHNTMHLLYSRFFTKVLYDLKLVDFKEPFISRRNHGIILGPDGQKMSKSKGNVIDPDEEVKKYGADCVRMYLVFMGQYEQGGPWNPTGILGIKRFLDRVWNLQGRINPLWRKESRIKNIEVEKLLHKTIKKVGEDIENFRFNTAISAMMVLLNEMEKQESLSVISYQLLVKLLSPFAPHLSEEIWQNVLGSKKSIYLEKWPKYNPKLIKEDSYKLVVQINGKMREVVEMTIGSNEEEVKKIILPMDSVKKWIDGKEIRKVIFVKDRLMNFIV